MLQKRDDHLAVHGEKHHAEHALAKHPIGHLQGDGERHGGQAFVAAELLMGALLGNNAVLDNKYFISLQNGGKASVASSLRPQRGLLAPGGPLGTPGGP